VYIHADVGAYSQHAQSTARAVHAMSIRRKFRAAASSRRRCRVDETSIAQIDIEHVTRAAESV
jgi:hypothetical protein